MQVDFKQQQPLMVKKKKKKKQLWLKLISSFC